MILCWGYLAGPGGGALAGLGRRWGCTAPGSPWRVIIMIGAGTLVWDGSLPGEACRASGWRSRGTPTRRLPSPAPRCRTRARAIPPRRRPLTPTHRNNPICKNPPFSRTAVGLYGGGDGGVDSRPCLFQFLFV